MRLEKFSVSREDAKALKRVLLGSKEAEAVDAAVIPCKSNRCDATKRNAWKERENA